ncbi:mechanosensitive ion channel family protein [Thermodesulfobacteriota bacterium]
MIFSKVIYGNVTLFDMLIALFILALAVFSSKIIAVYLRRFFKEKIPNENADIIIKIITYAVFILAITIVLPMLGVKLSGLLVAGGIVGLAVGFASQSIVGNLISGIFLMIERPVKIGNSVNIDGDAGIVEEIRIMSTTLRTFEGLYLRIPNQKIFTANITNFVANAARRIEYTVGIRYEDDADKAIGIIKDLINRHTFILINPESQVFVDNLGDNAVNIMVRMWAPTSEWLSIKTEMLLKIKKALEEQGIEIAFPQRVLWFANDPAVKKE